MFVNHSQSCPTPISDELITDLRVRFEKVLKSILPPPDKKQKQYPHLSDVLFDCFSSLSPKCREEELEDLLFFILDLYTFHGIPIAVADIDTIDQVMVDLRCALEEHGLNCPSVPFKSPLGLSTKNVLRGSTDVRSTTPPDRFSADASRTRSSKNETLGMRPTL